MKLTILKRVINTATLISFLLLFLIACGSEDAKFVVSSKKRIVVNPPLTGINTGTTLQYTASLIDEEGEVSDVTEQVSWSSTAPAVATVDSSGLAFGVATGTAGIVAVLDRLKDSTVLEVTGKTVGSVTVLPGEAFTLIGLDKQFTAVAQFTDGTQQEITGVALWSSSDTAVASISAGTALGVGVGQATLTASFSGHQSTALLLVSSASPVGLVIDPKFTSMPASRRAFLL